MASGRYIPVVFIWKTVDVTDDDGVVSRVFAMVPLARYDNLAKRQFSENEEYPLAPIEARSRASHSHFFAAIKEGFDNLPENIAARWPTAEHLRKWLLIEAGWFHESEIDCSSEKTAKQTAVLMRSFDGYARISIHGAKVIVRRAKSQSASAMGKQEFEDSKRDVLDALEHMTQVAKGELMKQAKRGHA